MSKLDVLIVKPVKRTIGPLELDIQPLSMDNFHLFVEMESADSAKKSEIIKKIVGITLKKSVPDATDEEINNISLMYLMDLFNVIIEINGLDEDNERIRKLKGKNI